MTEPPGVGAGGGPGKGREWRNPNYEKILSADAWNLFMKFKDPQEIHCVSCGVESAIPVRDLLALTAHCPSCHASFSEIGLSMRRTVDEVSAGVKAITIIMHVEEQLGVTFPDEPFEAVCDGNELTLDDLAAAVRQSVSSDIHPLVHQAILTAMRTKFPDAPDKLDFNAPLPDALSQPRKYGNY